MLAMSSYWLPGASRSRFNNKKHHAGRTRESRRATLPSTRQKQRIHISRTTSEPLNYTTPPPTSMVLPGSRENRITLTGHEQPQQASHIPGTLISIFRGQQPDRASPHPDMLTSLPSLIYSGKLEVNGSIMVRLQHSTPEQGPVEGRPLPRTKCRSRR